MQPLHLPLDDGWSHSFPHWSIQTSFAHLDRPAAEVAGLGQLLSPDERQRAARFVYDRDRGRYTVCRATLRQLLGRYTGADPASIEFHYGPHGKPFVDGPLHFNVSHSDSLALFAISPDAPVGCDVERIRPLPDLTSIVSRWFAPAECDRILGAPACDRETLFFRYWTVKEAVLKGLGTGLSLLSRDFAVHEAGDGRFRARGAGELVRWTAIAHAAPEGFAAAVATTGRDGSS